MSLALSSVPSVPGILSNSHVFSVVFSFLHLLCSLQSLISPAFSSTFHVLIVVLSFLHLLCSLQSLISPAFSSAFHVPIVVLSFLCLLCSLQSLVSMALSPVFSARYLFYLLYPGIVFYLLCPPALSSVLHISRVFFSLPCLHECPQCFLCCLTPV